MVKAIMYGQMVKKMKEIGKKITCMAVEFTPGRTDVDMTVNI